MSDQSVGTKAESQAEIKLLGEEDPSVITYSRALPVALTRVCRNNCGYCAFHRKDNLAVPYSTIKLCKMARANGAREMLCVAGERPDRFPQIRATLDLWGFDSYLDYVYTICELGFLEGLIPVIELGLLSPHEIKKLSEMAAMLKLNLDTVDADRHTKIYPSSPGKRFETRFKSLVWATKLGLPVATGIMVGLGETKAHRRECLKSIAELAKQTGMIAEVLIQNLVPEPGTPFASMNTPNRQDVLDAAEMALTVMPKGVRVSVPLEGNPDIADFIRLGIRDVGRIYEGQRVMFTKTGPISISTLEKELEALGFHLQQRFPLSLAFIREGKYSKKMGQVFDAYRYKIKKDDQQGKTQKLG